MPIFDHRRQCWQVVDYHEIRRALADPRLVVYKPLMLEDPASYLREDSTSPGAKSRRLGGLAELLAKHMGKAAVARLRPTIAELFGAQWRTLCAKARFDLVSDFFQPVAQAVIWRILGLQSPLPIDFSEVFAAMTLAQETQASAVERRRGQFALYALGAHIAERRVRRKQNGLVAAMEQAAKAQGCADSVVDYWTAMLTYAGTVTTRDLLANVAASLLKSPRQDWLENHNAVEQPVVQRELLRLHGPVESVARVARAELRLGRQIIRRGDIVQLHLAAGNRDPKVFGSATRPSEAAEAHAHLAFGLGVTRCLGAQLAELELELALGVLLPELPRLRLVRAERAGDGSVLRTFRSLQVVFAQPSLLSQIDDGATAGNERSARH